MIVRLMCVFLAPGASPEDIAFLLARRPNIFCELSAQGPAHGVQRVFTTAGLRPAWRDLIVAHPGRFMVGTDPCCGHEARYDQLIREARELLLAHLPPPVIPRVAYQNAVRELRLK